MNGLWKQMLDSYTARGGCCFLQKGRVPLSQRKNDIIELQWQFVVISGQRIVESYANRVDCESIPWLSSWNVVGRDVHLLFANHSKWKRQKWVCVCFQTPKAGKRTVKEIASDLMLGPDFTLNLFF